MTDLQDAILDRLVGLRVGTNWPDGPLAIAAEVVGGSRPVKFGLTDNDRGAKREIATRLGYPVLLIEAIQGAVRALPEEDDRRAFALAVFRLVPVRTKPPRLSSLAQNRIAGRMAIRAHPYVCPTPDCPVPVSLSRLMDDSLGPAELARASAALCSTIGQPLAAWRVVGWLTARSTREQRLLQTAAQVVIGLAEGRSMGGWCSIRESARLAASERGVAEAVAVCAEIARQCGLPVTG